MQAVPTRIDLDRNRLLVDVLTRVGMLGPAVIWYVSVQFSSVPVGTESPIRAPQVILEPIQTSSGPSMTGIDDDRIRLEFERNACLSLFKIPNYNLSNKHPNKYYGLSIFELSVA